MYTRRMPEQFLFTKEKGSLFNVKVWMKPLVKKSTLCYGNENRNRNLWRIKLMNNKRIIIGVTIGIIAAILWSVVFINVLNSMAGIGIGICLGISFGISGSLIFSKKDKDK